MGGEGRYMAGCQLLATYVCDHVLLEIKNSSEDKKLHMLEYTTKL